MTDMVIQGFILGIALALLIGPVFFLLINVSIKNGFSYAIYLAIGVALSDIFYILLTYIGTSYVDLFQKFQFEIGSIGGSMLVLFGIMSILKAGKLNQNVENEIFNNDGKPLLFTLKGFALNTLNPFVIVFWLGVAGSLSGNKGVVSHINAFFFFLTVIITVFGTDLLKAYLAVKLKRVLNQALLVWLNRISGVIIILFGLRMLFEVFALSAK